MLAGVGGVEAEQLRGAGVVLPARPGVAVEAGVARGGGDAIPPNAVMVFDMEVVSVL